MKMKTVLQGLALIIAITFIALIVYKAQDRGTTKEENIRKQDNHPNTQVKQKHDNDDSSAESKQLSDEPVDKDLPEIKYIESSKSGPVFFESSKQKIIDINDLIIEDKQEEK